MPYSLPLVIGPLCGALAAPYFFTKIYQPLKVDLEEIDKEMEEEANAP